MSQIGDAIQAKCLAFGDRIIKLNDYLLEQAASSMSDVGGRKPEVSKGKSTFIHQPSDISQPSSILHQPSYINHQTSYINHQTSYINHNPSRVPVHLKSVATLANQLLRSGTSIGANNAEATNAISKADYKSKSYIALKEARESLYWLELLHRNDYLSDVQFNSIYADCEELVKLLVHRCKKLDGV